MRETLTRDKTNSLLRGINLIRKGQGFFWEARTRILALYALLMTGFIGLSIPIFSELVLRQVNVRVRQDLAEELETFEAFLATHSIDTHSLTHEELDDLFSNFLVYKIPEDDTFLITILNKQFYSSSPRALPEVISSDSSLMQIWVNLTQKTEEQWITSDSQRILYIAEPIISSEGVQGVLVAAHLTEGEIQEALDTVTVVVEVLLIGLTLALICAWIISGKVLTPLRSLATTARAISESDLGQRIPVQGNGEIATLTKTFNEMMDRLQIAFISQKAFINDAGHELRTPITIIRGHLELLDDDPQEQQETLELVLDELDRMNRFVDDLLLLVKSERPDFLQWERVDIQILTQEFYLKATALANRYWQLENPAQGTFRCDRQRLTQAIMNLAQNAAQHTQETDTITIGSALDKNTVRFWVRDTGEGIVKDDQRQIFERFARAGKSRRRSEGAGLGLSIVLAIAQAHGGRVELLSELGKGSTFTLVLPLNPRNFEEKRGGSSASTNL